MEKEECTMEDIVELVNNSKNDFIIHVEFGEGEYDGEREETFSA